MNKYFYLSSAIHTSSVLSQRPDHRLFKDLDWDRVESGEYAIVDPLDPNAILYLPERDYIIQTRVSQTQGNKPVILATPRDKRPASVSVDTPIAVPAVSEKSDSDGPSDKGGDSKSETPALIHLPPQRLRPKIPPHSLARRTSAGDCQGYLKTLFISSSESSLVQCMGW